MRRRLAMYVPIYAFIIDKEYMLCVDVAVVN